MFRSPLFPTSSEFGIHDSSYILLFPTLCRSIVGDHPLSPDPPTSPNLPPHIIHRCLGLPTLLFPSSLETTILLDISLLLTLCRCPAHRKLAASVVLISSDHQRWYSSSVNVIFHSPLDQVFYVRFFFQRYLLALQDDAGNTPKMPNICYGNILIVHQQLTAQ
jgi:hypothetical protein